MEALHDVVRAGKARYLGASSMYAWQFAKAQHTADLGGWTRFVVHAGPLQPDLPRGGAGDAPALPRPGRRRDPVEPARPRRARRQPHARGPDHHPGPAATRSPTGCTPTPTSPSSTPCAAVAEARGLPLAQMALAWMLHKRGDHRADRRGHQAGPHRGRGRRGRTSSSSEDEIAALETPYVPHPVLGSLRGGDRARPGRRRARLGQREDHGGHRADGRAAPARHRRGAVQGRAGLHRPRLPHARRRAARPQPRPGARRGRPDRPARPARRGGRRDRRRRGRDGPVRRSAGRRPRLHGPGRCAARRAGGAGGGRPRAVPQPRRAAARVPPRSTPAGQRARLAGVVLNRVGSARHEEVLRAAADEVGLPVLGRAAPARRAGRSVPAPRARHRGRARGGGDGGGGRDGRAGGRARRPRRGGGGSRGRCRPGPRGRRPTRSRPPGRGAPRRRRVRRGGVHLRLRRARRAAGRGRGRGR